jgi:hypothetical protein
MSGVIWLAAKTPKNLRRIDKAYKHKDERDALWEKGGLSLVD